MIAISTHISENQLENKFGNWHSEKIKSAENNFEQKRAPGPRFHAMLFHF